MTSVTTDRRFGVNSGAAVKVPCRVATTANITLSGHQTIDGQLLVDDDRVLVKNQTDQKQNGIYVVNSGTWARAPDWDGSYDAQNGSLVYITSGTTNGGLFYVCNTANPITIGTTSVSFAVVALSSLVTIPLPITQGGSGQATKAAAAAALGVVVLTGAAGTANAQTATAPANYTVFGTDDLFVHVPSVTNNAATTLTVTPSGGAALSAKNVFCRGAALTGGELRANVPVLLLYDGTQLNIIGLMLTLPSLTVTGATTLVATNVAALTASGTVTAQGLVDISGAAAGQIAFPAAQNASAGANTLDDYEEGTWTPSVGGSATYSSQIGQYTKVGDSVFVIGSIIINTIGTGSTNSVSGLPFANNATSSGCPAVGEFSSAANTFTSIALRITPGASSITVKTLTAAGTSMGSTAFFGNSTFLAFSGIHKV